MASPFRLSATVTPQRAIDYRRILIENRDLGANWLMVIIFFTLSLLTAGQIEQSDAGVSAPDPAQEAWRAVLDERRAWWSLQPVTQPEVPAVGDPAWSNHPVDRFLLEALEENGLRPAGPAGPEALLRRMSFILTGLPPSPEEVEEFSSDPSPDAYKKVVDRLLASPQFGERWARHWMDVVGFAETHGYEHNIEARGVWHFRDYLIRAFNQDVPFDQLVREHIAGDLLENPRWDEIEKVNESITATAFLRFGEMDHGDGRLFPEIGLNTVDHQVDTLAKAFQAMTVSCARCHDHKLDAVSMRDYYALSGVLVSSRQVIHTIDRPGIHEERKGKLRQLKPKIKGTLAPLWLGEAAHLSKYLSAAQTRYTGMPEAERLAEGLDPERLSKWVAVLKGPEEPKKTEETEEAEKAKKKPARELTLADIDFPWKTVVDGSVSGDVAQLWAELKARYEAEHLERKKFNADNFVPLADFRSGQVPGWDYSGLALEDGPTPSGDFVLSGPGERVIQTVLQSGLHTRSISSRLNASLRSPLLSKDKKFVSFEVAGGGGGAWRNVYDNCPLFFEGFKPLDWEEFRWQRASTASEEGHLSAFIAFVTKLDNQAYPTITSATWKEILDPNDIRSYFSVRRVVLHDCDESPKDELDHMLRLFRDPQPRSLADVAERYARVMAQSLEAWAETPAETPAVVRDEGGAGDDDDALWVDWLVKRDLLPNSLDCAPRLQEWILEYRALEEGIAPPKLVVGLAEFDRGFDVPLRVRGNAHQPGEFVPRRYLEILGGTDGQLAEGAGSGRRLLAELVARAENPLTARVLVNRIWHHLFGAGIVRTPDDFGQLGEAPSHPELLDYLASRFVRDGWSMKKLIRFLIDTKAFRMSSGFRETAREADPGNRLLHHYPLRRLEGEAIRDAILAVSGRLDRALYGRSIHPYRVLERPDRRLFCGPLDGDGRRSIYIRVTLTEEPPFLSVFNLPDPKTAQGRRAVTNVPAQALALLNDPFVLEAAGIWAERLVREGHADVGARIRRMFLEAIGRLPTKKETTRVAGAVERFAALRQIPPGEILASKPVWKDAAHALFNAKEFIYLR